MKHNILRSLSLLFITSVALFSCREDKFINSDTELGGKGVTFVKVLEGPVNPIFFTPFTDIKKVDLFSVRRDNNSPAQLNSATKVKLTENAAAITAYNTANTETFEVLPASIYTLVTNPSIVKTATGYEFNFASGEFAKELTINLNGALFDLSKKYALAFDITDGGGATITKTAAKSIIVLISLKNKYDGIYSVEGTMVDIISPTLSHFSNFINSAANTFTDKPYKLQLRTVSATKCAAYDEEFFGDGANAFQMPITSGVTYSRYGSFGIIIEFDPVTDKVVAVTNYYGQPAANTRAARLDPSGVNTWSGGTMKITYNMQQSSAVPVAPNVRTTWDETWQYLGARK